MNYIFTLFLLVAGICSASAKDAYNIKVKIKGFAEKQCFLAYHYGEKQYMKDTAAFVNGECVFKGEKPLEGGIYLVVLPPENKYFEIIVNEQFFSVETDTANLVEAIKITGSKENELFYGDMHFIAAKRKESEALKKKMEGLDKESKETKEIKNKLEELDKEVKEHRRMIMTQNSNLLYAKILKAMEEPEVPQAPKKEDGTIDSTFAWRYYRSHFFDGMDFSDDRLLRTPIFHTKLIKYVDELTVQHPDSLNRAADYLIGKARANEEVFKYVLITLVNKYAASNVMGQDAVYVYLIENYYAKGAASWADSVSLYRLTERATALKPLLIGKKAPNLVLKDTAGVYQVLYNIEAPYTVLFFYDPDCGHCKKSTPPMMEVYNKLKGKGLKVYAIATEIEKEKWVSFINEFGTKEWINVADIELQNNFRSVYDIKSTPVIFLLDEKKEIIAKRLGPEQLGEYLESLIEKKQAASN